MHIIRYTQFFQLTKKSKNPTCFVSSECELNRDFQKCIAFGEGHGEGHTCLLYADNHGLLTKHLSIRVC